MKKYYLLLTALCMTVTAALTSCQKGNEFDVPTRPTITFETSDDAMLVKATIKSDVALKSVAVTKTYGTGTDEHKEDVETITTFKDAKNYIYEKTFEVPAGYPEMYVVIVAENTKGMSVTAKKRLTKDVTITIADVVDAMSEAYKFWQAENAMPESVNILEFSFNKPVYFEYACRAFLAIYNSSTTMSAIDGSYLDCEDNERPDTFENETISANMLNDAVNKMLNFANNNGTFPNYASYGSVAITAYEDPDGVKYEGYFTYRRTVVCVARMLDYYKTNGALGEISSEWIQIEQFKPESAGTFKQSDLIDGIAGAYAEWEKNYEMPESITVASKTLSQVQYFHAAIQLLLNIQSQNTADIEVLTYLVGENPANDSYDRDEINVYNGPAVGTHTEDLANICTRFMAYVTDKNKGNGTFCNYSGYTREGDVTAAFSHNRLQVCLARAIAAYKTNGSMPETIATRYLAPVSVTMQLFAEGAVPALLKAWNDNVGTPDAADLTGAAYETGTEVHYIPQSFSYTLDGVSYSRGDCYEILARGLQALMPSTTTGSVLTDGVTTAELIPTAHAYAWGGTPYNEGKGNGGPIADKDGNLLSEVPFNVVINLCYRNIPWAENHMQWSNMSGYPRTYGDYTFDYTGCVCLERHMMMVINTWKYLLDNKITENVATAVGDAKVSCDLYGVDVKPATISDFAKAFAGIVAVWDSNVGNLDAALTTGANSTENVHFVPANQTITVNNVTMDKATMYEAAVRSLLTMVVTSDKGGTIVDGIAMTENLAELHTYGWGDAPYNEGEGNGGEFKHTEVEFAWIVNFASRELPWMDSHTSWSNLCGYPRDPMTAYNGCCCLERHFITMARLFKYLVDNNITENIYTACKDVKFDCTLY